MSDKKNSAPLFQKAVSVFPEPEICIPVKTVIRLIQNQQVGLKKQSNRKIKFLFGPTAQTGNLFTAEFAIIEVLRQLFTAIVQFLLSNSIGSRKIPEVFINSQL